MLPISPQEATKIFLSGLASRRMRDIVEKRFGLRGRMRTLDAIGREYKITRERVRQIEADALKNLRKGENLAKIRSLLTAVEECLWRHGRVISEEHLFSVLGNKRHWPHLALLMEAAEPFHRLEETETFFSRWTLDRDFAEKVEEVMEKVVRSLEERGSPVLSEALFSLIASTGEAVLGAALGQEAWEAYLRTSKAIRQNPYGEYGLVSWPAINPRGMRDKAYLILVKSGGPLHFTAVARSIDAAGFSKRKAHPQTVHNELIKDPRFVLVGRGLYALREWGYEPGVVREVMASILKSSGKPLEQEEIVKRVCEKRFVKPQTVILNLQNKGLFKKMEDGKYTLV